MNLLCRMLSLLCGKSIRVSLDELSVKAYLYSTVRNKALNVLKHRKIEQHYVNEILQDEDAELYYMRSVIEEEIRRLIFTAIDSLPEHCRKVCLLNLEGMDNQEIADELQVSLNTVKFHKKNAYKLLRDKLKTILSSVSYLENHTKKDRFFFIFHYPLFSFSCFRNINENI